MIRPFLTASHRVALPSILMLALAQGCFSDAPPDGACGDAFVSSQSGWTRALGSLPPFPPAALTPSIALRVDGGIFVGAILIPEADPPPTPSATAARSEIVLCAYATDGSVDWALDIDRSAEAFPYDAVSDPDGILVAGYLNGTLRFDSDIEVSSTGPALFIARISEDGTPRWAVPIHTGDVALAPDLALTSVGDTIWFAASFVGDLDAANQRFLPREADRDIVVGRLSSTGELLSLFSVGTSANDSGPRLAAPRGSDRVAVAFSSEPPDGASNDLPSVTLLEVDDTGRLSRVREFAAATSIEVAAILALPATGGTLLALNVEGALSTDGLELEAPPSATRRRAVLVAIGPDGDPGALHALHGGIHSELHDLALAPTGEIIATGMFLGSLETRSPAQRTITGGRWPDGTAAPTGFIAAWQSLDDPPDAIALPRLNSRVPTALLPDSTGGAYLAGVYQTPLDLGPGELPAPDQPAAFLARLPLSNLIDSSSAAPEETRTAPD